MASRERLAEAGLGRVLTAKVVGEMAAELGVCVRPVLRRVTDRVTGTIEQVTLPCGSATTSPKASGTLTKAIAACAPPVAARTSSTYLGCRSRAAASGGRSPRRMARRIGRRCSSPSPSAPTAAAIEPQRRLAPHMHLAIRGAIPRQVIGTVTKATYLQLWWPSFDVPVHADPESMPVVMRFGSQVDIPRDHRAQP